MSCWPDCNPWCVCENGHCRPSELRVNALLLRTRDGRPVRARFGGGNVLEASTNAVPGNAVVFLLTPAPPPAPAPPFVLNSGNRVSLVVPDGAWAPSQNLVRVEHGARYQPPKDPHSGPGLDYYVMGGPDTWVWASPPFSPGFPAYTGTDPDEWSFFIDKAGGGPFNSGDGILHPHRQDANRRRSLYFRVNGPGDPGDPGDPAEIYGDGTAPYTPETAFVITLTEVRAPMGVRPAEVVCQVCAAVTGTVLQNDAPVAGAGASVTVQGAAVTGHPFSATTGADGRFRLTDAEGHDCIPPGPLSLTVTADNGYKKAEVIGTVPSTAASTRQSAVVSPPSPARCSGRTPRRGRRAASPCRARQ